MNKIIIYKRDGVIIGFRMKGHAGAEEKGRDLVCAALSVLSQNTWMSIEKLAGLMRDEDYTLIVDEKIPLYQLTVKNINEKAQVLLNSFALGAKVMQNSHPKYVKLTYEEV